MRHTEKVLKNSQFPPLPLKKKITEHFCDTKLPCDKTFPLNVLQRKRNKTENVKERET